MDVLFLFEFSAAGLTFKKSVTKFLFFYFETYGLEDIELEGLPQPEGQEATPAADMGSEDEISFWFEDSMDFLEGF